MRRCGPIALLVLAVGAGAYAQGLGELAEQEKARRRKQRDTAKVFTNDDLPQHAPSPSPSPSPSPTARPPAGATRATRVRPRTAPRAPAAQEEQPGPSEAEPPSESQASPGPSPSPSAPAPDEAGAAEYWRGRAQELHDAVAAAEKRVAEAQTKVDRSRKGVGQPQPIDALKQIPPNPALKSQELVGVEDELAAAQADLARAQSALAELEDEARRKGALPGWLR